MRILFGDVIFVSEGWSLDGLAFLEVASEILVATERIREREHRPEGIEAFSPFVLERRSRFDYVATFATYLSRPDCRWSGFPILAEDADLRARLIAALKNVRNGGRSAQFAIEDAFFETLGDERIGQWIARVAMHERRLAQRSVVVTEDRKFHFYGAIRPHLMAASANLPAEFENHAKAIADLVRTVDPHRDEIFSSSKFLAFARQESDRALHASLNHLVRLTYMDISASFGGASFQTPAIVGDEHRLMKAIEVAAYDTLKSPDIAFVALADEGLADFRSIAEESDWSGIWESVIRLSLNPEWLSALAEFREQTSDLLFRETRLTVQAFAKLEALLRRNCPELVVEQTRSERLGLNLKVAKTIEYLGQAGAVAAVVAAINVPLALLALGAPHVIEKITAGVANEWLKPLTGEAYLKSTILRAFKP